MPDVKDFKLNIYSPKHLAFRLKFPIKDMERIVYNKNSKVETYTIKQWKKDGRLKKRSVNNPSNDYKRLLRIINKSLFNNIIFPPGVCGGIKGKTLRDMVDVHCGKESVYVIDLQDFYPNISSIRITGLLKKMGCSQEIAEFLTSLVTFEDKLPQGFPTSTMLANLIAFKMDIEQLAISEKSDLLRTRWIDDIVFSGRIKDLEKATHKIDTSVKYNNFIFNRNKTNFSRRNDSPIATGLGLDKHKPYVPAGIIEKLEDVLQFTKEYGADKAKECFEEYSVKKDFRASLAGQIRFISEYNPLDGVELKALFNSISWQE